MKILGIIPARYASTRFPGKPLADIAGKSMIQRVYEQVKKSTCITAVIVATDNHKIFKHVRDFNGEVCMTSENHVSGTDRCYEALSLQNEKYDYVINVQGDEPFIQPEQIDLLARKLNGEIKIATLIKSIQDVSDVQNSNVVKVVVDKNENALYFSRSAIPHVRNEDAKNWVTKHQYYKHIGMYAYRCDVLSELTKLPTSTLEKAESLEQLRWLENGYQIATAETQTETFGIDTHEDLMKAVSQLEL